MAMTERDDLENLFSEARALRPEPGDDLMARILADAEAVAAERERPVRPVSAGPGWRNWLRTLGGWPAVGGLVASTVAGLWIGVAQPAALSDIAASVWGEQVSVNLGVDVDPLSLLEG
ncbi:Dihydroorotate dehydrogenase [Rubellimicrobium mesophilum DSM 19309]|uniref:Dihydroorotate dehydrogenase n=1 Tax=Rubellimicrobium mesophilum DSM 19309 TaxID=442562 RepID=A0A017HNY8_9RHOB|nr:hypothetical protein [Rubellimicrobium mesophilum]EYD75489.1 Dihydroorotate dehydrogenase [Rubellimicrobium mesophilum DSM 19309]